MARYRNDARQVIWALAAELERRHGITRVYGRATESLAVLSVTTNITVWTDGVTLRWYDRGIALTWNAADVSGAADRIAAQAARE